MLKKERTNLFRQTVAWLQQLQDVNDLASAGVGVYGNKSFSNATPRTTGWILSTASKIKTEISTQSYSKLLIARMLIETSLINRTYQQTT